MTRRIIELLIFGAAVAAFVHWWDTNDVNTSNITPGTWTVTEKDTGKTCKFEVDAKGRIIGNGVCTP
jgi:hypothetical protein